MGNRTVSTAAILCTKCHAEECREVSRQREGGAVEIVPPLVTGVESSLSAVADDKGKRKKKIFKALDNMLL